MKKPVGLVRFHGEPAWERCISVQLFQVVLVLSGRPPNRAEGELIKVCPSSPASALESASAQTSDVSAGTEREQMAECLEPSEKFCNV